MHHDDTAPTTPTTAKTVRKAVRPPKVAKKAPGGAKRVSGKASGPKKGTRKPPHLIKKDAQVARAKRAASRDEEAGEEVARGRTILLGEMAEFINGHFGENLNEFTPYDWWRRHKIGTLSTPLPKPQRMIGTGPLFLASDIVKWYKIYVASKGRWGTGA